MTIRILAPRSRGKWNQEASATGFNETSPMQLAIRVPTINPIKTEMERRNPLAQTSMTTMMRMVIKAAIKFFASPKSLACAFPPPIFWKATGIKVSPITVIKVPVTTGGKSFLIFENHPAIKKTKIRVN